MKAVRLALLPALLIALLAAAAAPGAAVSPRETPPPVPETSSPSPSPSPVIPRVSLTAPRSLWLGAQVTLTVRVTPALPGASVAVESRRDGVWTQVAPATLDTGSQASLPWRPEAFGYVRLRASVTAGPGNAAAVSPSRRVIVNRPNRHHVPYRFAHYIVTVVHEYKLYYYEHGEMVRWFTVALGRPGYRTPIGTFRIFGKRKPAGGALGACAMFYRREGGIAIHGTDQPGLLRRFPRPFSHGCSRMYNSQALWLYERVPKGTTVRNIR